MGAQGFISYSAGSDAGEAFRSCVEQAPFELGHAPYTGSIAEKDEFVIVQQEPVFSRDAEALARVLLRDEESCFADKWGPAGAIAVRESESAASGPIGWVFFGTASE